MGAVRRFGDLAAMVTAVAAITMLVRPGSRGPQLVRAIGNAFVNAASGTVGAVLETDQQSPAAAPTSAGYNPAGYNTPGTLYV